MEFLIYHSDLAKTDLPELLKDYGRITVRTPDEEQLISEKIENAGFNGIFFSLDSEDKRFFSSFIKSLPPAIAESLGKNGLHLFFLSSKKELVSVLNFFERSGITVLNAPVAQQALEMIMQKEYN